MRVRSATGQKARVRAKCVRAEVVRCEVRACGQKSVTPNTMKKYIEQHERNVAKEKRKIDAIKAFVGRSKEYLLTYIERKIDARDARQTEVNLSQIQGNYIHNVSTTFKKGFIATTVYTQESGLSQVGFISLFFQQTSVHFM